MRARATKLASVAPAQLPLDGGRRSSRIRAETAKKASIALAAWAANYLSRMDLLKTLLDAAYNPELAAALPVHLRCVVHNGRACNICHSGESIVGPRMWCPTCELNFCAPCASKHTPLDHILHLHRVPVPGILLHINFDLHARVSEIVRNLPVVPNIALQSHYQATRFWRTQRTKWCAYRGPVGPRVGCSIRCDGRATGRTPGSTRST